MRDYTTHVERKPSNEGGKNRWYWEVRNGEQRVGAGYARLKGDAHEAADAARRHLVAVDNTLAGQPPLTPRDWWHLGHAEGYAQGLDAARRERA